MKSIHKNLMVKASKIGQECQKTIDLFDVISDEFDSVRRFNSQMITYEDEIFQKIVYIIEEELSIKEEQRPGIRQTILDKWWSHMGDADRAALNVDS